MKQNSSVVNFFSKSGSVQSSSGTDQSVDQSTDLKKEKKPIGFVWMPHSTSYIHLKRATIYQGYLRCKMPAFEFIISPCRNSNLIAGFNDRTRIFLLQMISRKDGDLQKLTGFRGLGSQNLSQIEWLKQTKKNAPLFLEWLSKQRPASTLYLLSEIAQENFFEEILPKILDIITPKGNTLLLKTLKQANLVRVEESNFYGTNIKKHTVTLVSRSGNSKVRKKWEVEDKADARRNQKLQDKFHLVFNKHKKN